MPHHPIKATTQERGTLRSGIMVATRNPAVVGKVAKSFHAPSAILDPTVGIAKAESGSGKDGASDFMALNARGPLLVTEPEVEDVRIQPVGDSARSCDFN